MTDKTKDADRETAEAKMIEEQDWTFDHGTRFEDYEIIRRIRSSRNWITVLAENSTGDRKALTYIDKSKIIERYQMWAFQNGTPPDDLEKEAFEYLHDHQEKLKEAVDRVKGLECGHVATIHRYSYDREKDQLVIVSDFTPGVDIFEACRMLNWKQILYLFTQVLEGLREIHEFQFLHLNLKPSRIFVDFSPKVPSVMLSDFGFAVPVKGYAEKYNGTLFYMAPEVILEERDKIDYRADLFSFGVTFYYCLTGNQPFGDRFIAQSDKQRILNHVKREKNISTPPSFYRKELPPELDEFLMGLLQKEPEERKYKRAKGALNYIETNWPDECKTMTREGSTTLMSYDD
jgi:serine/threonine protein kinase